MRQSENKMIIVGTVKSKNVRTGNIGGTPTISLDVVVQSKIEDRINEVRVNFFAKEGSKLYAMYKICADELMTIKDNGNGTKVKITGSIEQNDFVSKENSLISNNRFKGLFINRLAEEDTTKECCSAAVECVVLNTVDVIKDGIMTGEKSVQALVVGYNDNIIELKDLVIAPHLANQFANIYRPNTTGKLYININNYAEVGETTVQEQVKTAFGTAIDVGSNVVKNFVNNLEIVGGETPKVQGMGAYTLQEIAEMRQLREQQKAKAMNKPTTTQNTQTTQPSGFGTAFGFGDLAPIEEGDIPF